MTKSTSLLPVGKRIAPFRFLVFGATFIVAIVAVYAAGAQLRIALMVGFDIAAFVFLGTTVPLLNDDVAAMRHTAEGNDANRAGLLAITVLLLFVILIAIGTLIITPATLRWPDIVLIVVTLVVAWIFANTMFMLHYAHLYYLQSNNGDRRGLEVPGAREPGYWDFLYFSFTLGMTFQTSDVTISGAEMRRVVLVQCIAAFLFNMGVLAFTINALGGL